MSKSKRITTRRIFLQTIGGFTSGALAVVLSQEIYEKIYEKAHHDLTFGIDDYVFNKTFFLDNQLDFELENEALTNVQLKPDVPPNVKPSEAIDSLFENSVMLGRWYKPTISIDDIVIDPQGIQIETKESAMPLYSSGWSNGLLLTNQGHILTALHVVEDKSNSHFHKNIVMDEAKGIYDVKGVLAYSKKYDIALLKSDLFIQNIASIYLLPEQYLTKGMKVYNLGRTVNGRVHFGFIHGSIEIENKDHFEIERYTSTGYFRQLLPFVTISTEGIILEHALLTDSFSRGGFSGSITVDSNGRIIGISSQSSESATYAAPASKIMGLIDFYLSNLQKLQK